VSWAICAPAGWASTLVEGDGLALAACRHSRSRRDALVPWLAR